MSGTLGKPVKPAHMSDSEWNLLQTNPRAWEIQHGWDWSHGPEGPSAFAMIGGGGGAGATNTQNNSITVNTVAGDSRAIADAVKGALADDWRSQGQKG